MASAKSGSISKFFVWAIIAMLIVGLGGFGVSNFGGRSQAVVSVGDNNISANEYYSAIRDELNIVSGSVGQNLTLEAANGFYQQAYGTTLDARVLDRLVLEAALDNEAARLGLSVGDARVLADLLQRREFQGLDGTFDEENYQSILRNAGQTVEGFENGIRDESARNLMQAAMIAGIDVTEAQSGSIIEFAAQRRSFTWIRLDQTSLTAPLPAPTDAELDAYYQANPADFTSPQTKNITYVWLSPDMLYDSVEIDEQTLRDLYEERASQYVVPERRLVERLVFGAATDADAAAARLAAGDVSFEALVTERGLALSDVDMGDVRAGQLSADAAAAVFALDVPGVSGAVSSSLGPAIFRVNAVLASQTTPFEEAEADLRSELATERARRLIDSSYQAIEDLLAGGATLEEVAGETDMELGQIEWWDGLGDDIAAYNGFRDAAQNVSAEDFPELAVLEDGGIYALRLNGITEPALQPLDAVRDDVISGWEAEETGRRLLALAQTYAGQIGLGLSAEAMGLNAQVEEGLQRGAYIDGTPDGFVNAVFDMEPGEVKTIPGPGVVLIAQVDEILPPDPENQDTLAASEELIRRMSQDLAFDIYAAWAGEQLSVSDTSRNQTAINSIVTQIP